MEARWKRLLQVHRLWVPVTCSLALIVAALWWLRTESATLQKSTHLLMGTIVEITLVGDPQRVKQVEEALVAELKRLERVFSFHLADSSLSQLNGRAGEGWVPADPELFNLIRRALEAAEQTGGAYDPTVGPLCRLWNFSGSGNPRLPQPEEITEALRNVGREKISLDPKEHRIRFASRGMALDLGGIAKGYALDRAGTLIREGGITSALVNAGGDILAVGERSPGRKWRVGVRDPLYERGIVATVEISDEVVLTSGDYERSFTHNGKNYHHILVPGTGYPAEGLRSVTLLGAEGTAVEPLGTATFVLGPDRGLKLIEGCSGVEALLITSQGEFVMTPGARHRFTLR